MQLLRGDIGSKDMIAITRLWRGGASFVFHHSQCGTPYLAKRINARPGLVTHDVAH